MWSMKPWLGVLLIATDISHQVPHSLPKQQTQPLDVTDAVSLASPAIFQCSELHMALVDYSSSEDEDERQAKDTKVAKESTPSEEGKPTLKRKLVSISDLPPLPSKFLDLYATATRVSTHDDPSLHGGRKRATPHIEGNWPTHVYIEWFPSTVEQKLLTELIASLCSSAESGKDGDKLHSLLTSDLGVPLPLHISLSRTLSFTADVKDLFLEELQKDIKSCGVRRFAITFLNLSWVPNFEKTRWFLVLSLGRLDSDSLNKLLQTCNGTAQEFGQPPLYAESAKKNEVSKKGKENITSNLPVQDLSDAFHITIAWTLEKPSARLVENTRDICANVLFENLKDCSFVVDEIKAKIGNIVTSIQLHSKLAEKEELF